MRLKPRRESCEKGFLSLPYLKRDYIPHRPTRIGNSHPAYNTVVYPLSRAFTMKEDDSLASDFFSIERPSSPQFSLAWREARDGR